MSPHHPKKLPINIDYGKFAKLLANAQFALGRLDGLQKSLKNPLLLIAPLTAKEATVSSKIEGTQSSVSDVFLHEAGAETKYRDVIEVANYKKAIYFAMSEFKRRPFSLNFIRDLHTILLDNTRGSGTRGMFRKDQVWIGVDGAPTEEATYIPPEWELVPEYFDNLEKYIHYEGEDALVQAALIHYQFEAVHPFNDGNGRIGRLLIPIFLHYKNRLSLPILYLSGYFDSNRDAYLDSLHYVDKTEDYERWIEYFLNAVIKQAKDNENLINSILTLYEETISQVQNFKSPYITRIIELLFKRPIIRVPQVTEELSAHRATVIRLFEELKRKGVITEVSGTEKKKLYVFEDLVKLL